MNLSEEQWLFLAVIEAFGGSVSIEIAGKLSPLLPGPLIDLLEVAESGGLIEKPDSRHLAIAEGIPSNALKKLKAINSPEHLSRLISQLNAKKLLSQIDTKTLARIMNKSGRLAEACRLEIEIAREAFGNFKHEQGLIYLKKAFSKIEAETRDPEIGGLFISSMLEWSSISFAIGKRSLEIEGMLLKALEIAEHLGDIRSRALLNLHLGRHYYFTDRRDEALVALSIGVDEIEEIGDADIHSQSNTFLGLHFFIQGRFKQAFEHLEKASRMYEDSENTAMKDILAPMLFGLCAAYLGKFHQAIGSLDFHCRVAMEKEDRFSASAFRSILGTVLVLLKKNKEAGKHLRKAKKEAIETGNALGLYLHGGGMILDCFLKRDVKKAYETLQNTIKQGTRAGLVRQFSSPWILEMLYEFDKMGYDPIPSLELESVVARIMDGVNCHLQGVCLRLKAKMLLGRSGSHMKIEKHLADSEKKLRESGDPVQTSKTLLERARLELIKGHRDEARQLAQEARHSLGGYIDEFFPDEFRHLIENKEIFLHKEFNEEQFLDEYLEMVESLYPIKNRTEILTRMLSATSQMFGAERSGLFWFSKGQNTEKSKLRASVNLPEKEIDAMNFKPSLNIILKTYRKNNPFSEKIVLKEFSLEKRFVRSVLCIPIEVKEKVHGVLYYDNSYLDNAFDFLNLSLIKRMVRHTNMVVEQSMEHLKVMTRADKLASEKTLLLDSKVETIITESRKIDRLLNQLDQVAATDSTVLITGETGTGKELFANRLHKKSVRHQAPFIVVDSTTIPETLLESELFGYEKGAFTGAEKLKIGCIEMADQGTLFLDEVGELPLAAQAKLLRALQEKTIRRVGGVTAIRSDFRLVAATNRDLVLEVEKGRFREDLYYRLNVLPFHLPPLCVRDKDCILLARHFIGRYAKKYNFSGFELSSQEKNAIVNYHWPGNVRELKNVMERAVLMSDGHTLELNLPSGKSSQSYDPFEDKPTLNEIQRRYIKHVLDFTNGKVSGPDSACEILGTKRTSLYSKMKSLGLKR